MRISVLVPVYNQARYVAQALDSILAQANTPGVALEVLAINDGSTDDTAAVLAGYGSAVRVLALPQVGLGAALNAGLRATQGEAVAFLDGDDLWAPGKLQRQTAALQADPDLDLVFGHVRQFISPELDEAARQRLHCPPEPAPGYFKGALLARRRAFEKVGDFNEDRQAGDFVDWYLRAQEAGLRSLMLPELVTLRRVHTANTAARDPASQIGYARVLRAALQRRRAAAGDSESAA